MPSDPANDPLDFDREDAPFLHPDGDTSSSPVSEPKPHHRRSSHHDRHDHHHHDDDDDDDRRHQDESQTQTSSNPAVFPQKLRLRLLITLFAIVLAAEMGLSMADSPLVRIYESITCNKYYTEYDPGKIGPGGEVEEELCKVKDVQTELAAVKGYMEFFDGLMSIFLAIPYGLLADRRGRKSTMCLSIPGFVLNSAIVFVVSWFPDVFPLRTVWLSSLAWLLGGGPVVAFAIIWTMMSDVTSEDERASIFFKFAIVTMAGELISNALGSWLMAMNPWIPMVLGYSLAFVGMVMSLTLPETMPASPLPVPQSEMSTVEMGSLSAQNDSRKETYKDDSEDERAPFTREKTTSASKSNRDIFIALFSRIRSYFTPYAFIFRNKQILLLLVVFLVYRLSRGSSWFLVQYISTRYAWTLAAANFLMAFRPVLTIPLFLFILPGISKHYLRRFRSSQKNLYLARASVICLSVGTLGIGLSPNIATFLLSMIVQALGAGFLFLTRALLTVLVKREETARLFTILELLQAVGNVIASLSITKVFQIGLELGGVWVGLAWMMTSMAFALVGISIWMFKLPPVTRERERQAEREL